MEIDSSDQSENVKHGHDEKFFDAVDQDNGGGGDTEAPAGQENGGGDANGMAPVLFVVVSFLMLVMRTDRVLPPIEVS